jgi:hypothetical protein
MTSLTIWSTRSFAMLSLSLLSSGCGEDPKSAPARIPTYHADVAPILAEHCATCHSPGEIAPFALLDYEDAKPMAEAIRAATAARAMPPFVLDNSGSCNTYIEAEAEGRWLSDAQIATLGAWASAGAPEGDPSEARLAEARPRITLDRVDKTIDMGADYTPDKALFDDYRCFVIDPAFLEDQLITGFDVRPGVPKMVHHLTLYALDSAEAEAQAEGFDAAEAGPGYSCIDDIRVDDARWLVGWGPGGGAIRLPEGTGLRMSAGRKTLLQMHYNQENGLYTDRTLIDVKLEKSVAREARVRRVAATSLNLPPKRPSVEETDYLEVPRNSTLWGLWPHMHKLGKALRVDAVRGSEESCVAKVHRWDFHWQGFAHYTNPVKVQEGDSLRITCTYDTMVRDTETTWGQGTMDEMCIAFFYMTNDDD